MLNSQTSHQPLTPKRDSPHKPPTFDQCIRVRNMLSRRATFSLRKKKKHTFQQDETRLTEDPFC